MTWRISNVCTLKGIRCPAWLRLHRPGLYPPHRRQGPRPHHLQRLFSRADGLSLAVARAALGYALEHTLGRLGERGDWLPATRALLHLRVISLRILAIIPISRGRKRRVRCLGSGLDIDLRRRSDDNRWIVGIWGPVVGPPVWPQGDDDTGPNEDTPTMPCVPRYRAHHEQHPYYAEGHQPLPSCGSYLGLVIHSTSLFYLSRSNPVVTHPRLYHHTPDDSDLATTEPIIMPL